ncbi:MAG: dTDP-4-amino-4,6-dideoxygalactose transaminase [Verrucomicrobia bacterium]|nr:dTDP-4-amino-4,6-dideoxygalactose transaminase [Verrucomicrobiota bacterium]
MHPDAEFKAGQDAIPFNRPSLVGEELAYVQQAIQDGHISGDNQFTKRCQKLLEEALQVSKCFLTTSGTHALEMASILLGVNPECEVIVPSFTFSSTANAFALYGARIVFADVRPDTLNIDETKIEPLISAKTKAIVVVHYGGIACEMDTIMAIAARHGIPVVEDNAHGLFGTYKGRHLGSIGCLGCQSFHETKNVSCGEGGALLVNQPNLIERAEIIREKGTDRSRFFRGEVDKYTWADVGSSFLPSDLLAAFLFAQLERWPSIQSARQQIWDRYHAGLASWATAHRVRLPIVPPDCGQAYHLYYLLLPTPGDRAALTQHLRDRKILSVFHYLPLNTSPMGRRFGGAAGQCPVAEDVSERLLRMPLYYSLTPDQQHHVIEAITAFRPGVHA